MAGTDDHLKIADSDAAPASFEARIETDDIFRALIEEEVRSGRLTPARRRRIVRYAAQLQLSAPQVGQMIEAARDRVLQDQDRAVRRHAMRLIEPPEPRIPLPWKLALVVVVAILIDLAVVFLL